MKRALVLATLLCFSLVGVARAEAKKAFNYNPVGCVDGFKASGVKVNAAVPEAWELKIQGKTPMLIGNSGKAAVTFILDRKAAKPTGILVIAPNISGEKKDAVAQVSSIMAMNAIVDMVTTLPDQQRMDLVAKLVDKASGGKDARLDAGQVAFTLSLAGGNLMFMATPAGNLK